MSTRNGETDAAPAPGPTGSILILVSIAALAAALTLLFLGMRAVMTIGGSCAEGGPYVIDRPCPKGIPMVILGSIWGGIVAAGVYAFQSFKHQVPSLIAFAWPALFLSLGWNFLEFGLDPPGGGGLAWGWLVCAVLFFVMGGGPVLLAVGGMRSDSRRKRKKAAAQARARFGERAGTRGTKRDADGPWGGTPAAVTETPPPDAGDADDLVDALERLDALHSRGGLTDEEYARAKRALLEQP